MSELPDTFQGKQSLCRAHPLTFAVGLKGDCIWGGQVCCQHSYLLCSSTGAVKLRDAEWTLRHRLLYMNVTCFIRSHFTRTSEVTFRFIFGHIMSEVFWIKNGHDTNYKRTVSQLIKLLTQEANVFFLYLIKF